MQINSLNIALMIAQTMYAYTIVKQNRAE